MNPSQQFGNSEQSQHIPHDDRSIPQRSPLEQTTGNRRNLESGQVIYTSLHSKMILTGFLLHTAISISRGCSNSYCQQEKKESCSNSWYKIWPTVVCYYGQKTII